MGNTKIKGPVQLSEASASGLIDLINLFIEYFVFFRWIYFKNRPRGNLLLMRAILVLGVWATVYMFTFSSFELVIEGIDIDPFMAVFILAIIGYWNMSNVFHKKSEFCFNLYNQYLTRVGADQKREAQLLANSLAGTLLSLDLWAHRSFCQVFKSALSDALDHNTQGNEQEMQAKIDRLNSGKMTLKEVRGLLDSFQGHLIGA